jgi:succinate-semialdehyde dehydrogenase / glutarate-semialdehyde dehydrogenase
MFKSVNPYNQEIIGEYPLHDDRAIQKKLETASRAFKSWRHERFTDRAVLVSRVGDVVQQHKEEYARIISLEMGKTLAEARIEVEKCVKGCRYFVENGEAMLVDVSVKTEAKRAFVTWQPTGAVFGIMPWNFPFWQVFRFVIPNILGGNVTLLKHAPNVSLAALTIEKIFLEAGSPEGIFQSLLIDVDKTEQIIKHDLVQGVTLTGSEYAGSAVAALAGKHIKKSVLELGGSDAFIVLDDADLDKAAQIGVQSRMQNAGQSCISAKRFIVLKKVKEEFLDKFRKRTAELKQGDPFDAQSTIGPMARLDLAEKLETQLQDALQKGAKLITGGKRNGCNFSPAIIDQVTPDMKAFQEETFGPMATFITAVNEEDAVAIANNSRYGLGSSIWTKDLEKAEALARKIEAGSVHVNSLMRSDARLPFGGIKKSGYGRELAEQGMKEFLNTKAIVLEP